MKEIVIPFMVVCLFLAFIFGAILPITISVNANAAAVTCKESASAYPKMLTRLDDQSKICYIQVRGDGGFIAWIPIQTFVAGLEMTK